MFFLALSFLLHGGKKVGVEAVAQLPQGAAQGFEGDMGVGHAHMHRLKTADAAFELAPLGDVLHSAADLLAAHPQLQR